MIETQMFLLFFGAVLTLIGVIIFFLLAWFKETTGESNVVKILQAEFRLSNPGLVIFIGGLGLMVAPFFLGQAPSGGSSPEPTPTPTLAPTPTFTPGPGLIVPTPEPSITPVPVIGITPIAPVDTPTPTLEPTATPEPPTPALEPTATPEPPTPIPFPTLIPTPEFIDIAGRWSNLQSHVDFFGNSAGGYDFVVYDNFGGIIAQGTASFDGYVVSSVGVNAFGFPFSAELFLVDYSTLEGTQYDAFNNLTQPITLIRQDSSFK